MADIPLSGLCWNLISRLLPRYGVFSGHFRFDGGRIFFTTQGVSVEVWRIFLLLLGFWFLKLFLFIYIFLGVGGGGGGCWYIDILTCIEVYLWIDQTKISHIYISNKSESESGQCFILFCDSFLMIENRVMRIKRRISILLILHLDYEERNSETSRCNYVMDKIKTTLGTK